MAWKNMRLPTWTQDLAVCACLAAAVWIVFGQTLGFDFVNCDDDQNVYDNPTVCQGLTSASVGWSLAHAQVCNWIPLTTLSHMGDCQMFGLFAGGHHFVNVLWHLAASLLLYLLLRRMTGFLWRSAFVAVLFAVHPLRAESVAWISERKDVMSAVFFMLALGAYARYARHKTPWGSVTVIALFCLGLLSKNMLITLPFVLLLLDYWPLQRFRTRPGLGEVFREKDPLMFIAVAWAAVGTLVPGLIINDDQQLTAMARVENAVVSYVIYMKQLVWPNSLAFHYPFVRDGSMAWKPWLGFVLLAAVTAWVVRERARRPYLLVGWFWYVGMLLPVIGIVQISADAAHSDRYTYLPEIGLALAATWYAADVTVGWHYRKWILGMAAAVIVVATILAGRRQTSYWKDSLGIWTHSLACEPNDADIRESLGAVLAKDGRVDDAISEFQKSIELDPKFWETHSDYAEALAEKGKLDQSMSECREALRLYPEAEPAFRTLGFVFDKKGELDRAIFNYGRAVQLDADDLRARAGLADARARKKKPVDSVR